MTDPASLPITRIAWRGAVRIIRSIFPPIDLFEDIADPADWPLLLSAEQKTNPRLMENVGALALVPPERRVDPHHWADAVRAHGFVLQLQPAVQQPGGVRLPATTHLTITPVTEAVLDELAPALAAGADAVRGTPHVDGAALLAGLPPLDPASLDADGAWALLQGIGIGGGVELPDAQAPLIALIEALPAPIAERLLVELLGRLVEP